MIYKNKIAIITTVFSWIVFKRLVCHFSSFISFFQLDYLILDTKNIDWRGRNCQTETKDMV